MARSSTVWVVTDRLRPWTAPVKAVFTVKHELVTWLEAQDNDKLQLLRLWRCQDGGGVLNVGGRDYFHDKQAPRPAEVPISEVLK